MTSLPDSLLLDILKIPQNASKLDPSQWVTLIHDARATNLLGSLARRLDAGQVTVPPGPKRHLDGATQLGHRQRRSVKWEVNEIHNALRPLQRPIVLLKGAAYVLAVHPASLGRLFGDIDILVDKDALGDVESRLMLNGWVSAKASPYDQRYYRKWMHELPPMTNVKRGTVLDIHHNILPTTSNARPDPQNIIARSTQTADTSIPWMRVPCPEDLLIHSLTHLVHEGELGNGLRDLNDIDVMVRACAYPSDFWHRFVEFAECMQLSAQVALGLTLAQRVFATPIPESAFKALAGGGGAPPRWLLWVYLRALPGLFDKQPQWTAMLARWVIYVRSHALRMPIHLLVPHLLIKGFSRLAISKKQEETP